MVIMAVFMEIYFFAQILFGNLFEENNNVHAGECYSTHFYYSIVDLFSLPPYLSLFLTHRHT